MAGFQIHLVPDRSFFAQLLIFLITLAGLTFFVYRPIIRIIKARRKKTIDMLNEAKRMEAEIKLSAEKYTKALDAAKEVAQREKEAIRQTGIEEEIEIKEIARHESGEILAEARVKIEAAKKKAVEELKKEIPSLAEEIINKIRKNKAN